MVEWVVYVEATGTRMLGILKQLHVGRPLTKRTAAHLLMLLLLLMMW